MIWSSQYDDVVNMTSIKKMVTTRSRAKSIKKAYDRKKAVWEVIRIADRIKEVLQKEADLPLLSSLDMPEISLALTAVPLCQEGRKHLIESAVF